MLELCKQKAKLTSVNPRAELHGEDTKLAVDLHFETACSNDILTCFDGKLKAALYKKGDSAQQELIKDASHLPVLKFPNLGLLKWDYTGLGYDAVIHTDALLANTDIKLSACTIDKIKFTCQDGGTVIVGLRIITHPGASDTGRLCEMVGQLVEITLDPPEEEQQQNAA